MKKSERDKIFNKFGGRCAYCGEDLQKGWHVDELKPCIRKYKFEPGHYRHKITKTKTQFPIKEYHDQYEYVKARTVFDGYQHPERLVFENQMSSCASCNINKHSGSLEDFRKLIQGFITSLNRDSVQYKIAKRYGFIKEEQKPVVFYFETVK